MSGKIISSVLMKESQCAGQYVFEFRLFLSFQGFHQTAVQKRPMAQFFSVGPVLPSRNIAQGASVDAFCDRSVTGFQHLVDRDHSCKINMGFVGGDLVGGRSSTLWPAKTCLTSPVESLAPMAPVRHRKTAPVSLLWLRNSGRRKIPASTAPFLAGG